TLRRLHRGTRNSDDDGDQVLSTRVSDLDVLALSSTHVYFAAPEGLTRVPKEGGGEELISSDRFDNALVLGTRVLASRSSAGIVAMDLDGRNIAEIDYARGQAVTAMAAEPASLYWAERGRIHRITLGLANAEVFTEGEGDIAGIAFEPDFVDYA